MRKVEFSQLQNWMRQMDFHAWGIQTGPFVAHSAHFVLKISHHFHFHTGEHFLLPQRANNGKSGIHPTSELDETDGI